MAMKNLPRPSTPEATAREIAEFTAQAGSTNNLRAHTAYQECATALLAAIRPVAQQELNPHLHCPRCHGTGRDDNPQFRCACRWGTSPLREKAEVLAEIERQHRAETAEPSPSPDLPRGRDAQEEVDK